MAMFTLYLVLVAMPRADESNIVETNLTQEACEQASGMANGVHRQMNPDATPLYLWICKPTPPPSIDHHNDMLEPV